MVDYSKGYFAAVLTDESAQMLSTVAAHPNVFCHHLTMAYEPSPKIAAKYVALLDSVITLQVVGIQRDDNGQEALVQDVPSEKEHPHITISCAKGIRPVYSDTLLRENRGTRFTVNLCLTARVQFIKHSAQTR